MVEYFIQYSMSIIVRLFLCVCVWLLLLPKLQRVNEYKAIVVENGNYGKLQSLICLLFYNKYDTHFW